MTRRRALLARASEDAPIYEAKNILFNGSAIDTGVLLSKENSSGWTIFYKIDVSQVTSDTYYITPRCGFYQYYCLFYVNSVQNVYGIKGFEPWWDLRSLPSEDRKKWLETFAVSVDYNTRKGVAYANDQIRRGGITEFSESTDTLVINPSGINDNIVVSDFRIYDRPMTEAQLQKLIES